MIYFSAVLAGLLTSLSPCVIGALPFVVNSSLTKGKFAPLLLVTGLIISFISIGILFTLSSNILGLEQEDLRLISASVFILIGLAILVQNFSFPWLSNLANKANELAEVASKKGLLGELIIGVLLGFVWAPCSGPTLGYALTLVAKEGSILKSISIMAIFGIFASVPLLIIAYLSRKFISKNMGSIIKVQNIVKKIMGVFLILFGIATITNFDRKLEGYILQHSPSFLIDLITKY